MVRPLRAATRGSALARLQTELVASKLDVDVEPVIVETTGDRRDDVPIWSMGGQGVFVKEVQAAVLEGRADFAVHSAKDLPSEAVDGLVIAAVPDREEPRDALVGSTLERLPVGGLVATGSVRRRAQLAAYRPDLTFAGLRGNVDTRLAKATRYDAIVVAAAALRRMGRSAEIADLLDIDVVLPQVGQGALAVECRAGDDETGAVLAAMDDAPSHVRLDTERAWLREVGSGCQLPVGALADVRSDGEIVLRAMIASLDGHVVLRGSATGRDAAELGARLARFLLDDRGGRALIDASELVP